MEASFLLLKVVVDRTPLNENILVAEKDRCVEQDEDFTTTYGINYTLGNCGIKFMYALFKNCTIAKVAGFHNGIICLLQYISLGSLTV